jgi:hypothetical protein
MVTRHAAIAALAALVVVPALAQDTLQPPAQAPETALRATGAYPIRQAQSQWLGSNLIGARVVSAADETIGRIANLVVNDDGAVEAAVISVGGIFGVGRKDVAVTFRSLNITRSKSGDTIEKVTLAATKGDMRQATVFKTLSQQRIEERAH